MGAPFCYLHSNTVTKSTGVDFCTYKAIFMRTHIFISRVWIALCCHLMVGIRVLV